MENEYIVIPFDDNEFDGIISYMEKCGFATVQEAVMNAIRIALENSK